MGLAELFVAVLIVGVSCINAALPAAAYGRSRDPRFAVLAGASGVFAILGAAWTWGQLPLDPPAGLGVSLPLAGLVLVGALLLLATTLWPRHA